MDRVEKGFDSLEKTLERDRRSLDSLHEIQSQPWEAGEGLEGRVKKLGARIDVLTRLEQICEEEKGDICEATASEREELCQRVLAELQALQEES